MAPKAISKAVALAHELLTKARDEGSDDAAWEEIFARLREKPAALQRPEPRKLSLLHQAAYWGHIKAVETLVKEFGADPKDLTADDDKHDAAAVADSQGHSGTAALLRKLSEAAGKKLKKAPGPEDIKLAHELLNKARDEGGEDATWDDIFSSLLKQPAALARPAPRKMSLLQQAAYWGHKIAVERLVTQFEADPEELTADGEDLNAAAVADSQGYAEVAKWLRDWSKKPASAGAKPDDAIKDVEMAEDDVDAASPYDASKQDNNNVVDELKGAVEVWLCLRRDGSESRWEPLPAADNSAIAAARSAGKETCALSDSKRSICFKDMRETAGGKQSKVCCFSVLWEWDDGAGGKAPPSWKPYPQLAQWQLEAARIAKDATCEVTPAGKKYVVDLVGFRQHSASDAFRTRRVRRRGVPLREAFPERVRDITLNTWLDLAVRPDYWEEKSNSSVAKRFDLPMDSPIIPLISEWMNASIRQGHAAAYGQVAGKGGPLKGAEVVRVEVVQQPALWRRYCCYRGQMQAHKKAIQAHAGTKYLKDKPMAVPACEWLDQSINEAYFWHGSGKSPDGSIDLIDAIVSVGHEPSDENSEVMEVSDGASSRFAKNSSMFGSGVYLADLASKANLYVPCPLCHQGAYFRDPCSCTKAAVEKAGPYRMLLCRAVLGRVYVERSYKDARYKGEFNPAKKLGADSVMGEAKPGQLAFREYVVYNDSASYPEFIVHYRRLSYPVKADGPGPKKKAKKA